MLFEQMFWVSSKIHHENKIKKECSKRRAETWASGVAHSEGGSRRTQQDRGKFTAKEQQALGGHVTLGAVSQEKGFDHSERRAGSDGPRNPLQAHKAVAAVLQAEAHQRGAAWTNGGWCAAVGIS